MAEVIHDKENLKQRANDVLVGGVNSPVRAFNYVGGDPVFIKNGSGAKIYDYDGKGYIDYMLSFGALILGHSYPDVKEAVKKAAENGLHFGATTLPEIELAELIQEAIPAMEKIRFVSSGTEAVMGAIRLARGTAGRDKIVKFANAYHGHADYLLVKGGSGLASLNIPLSKGVPQEFIDQTIVVDYGNQEAMQEVFDQHGKEIAAVIVEPVGGNYGVIQPDEQFLKYLRTITQANQALLIFDEVITGFRFRFGSFADMVGIKPDLMCLGKIIGGGLPIGAYGGVDAVMKNLAPLGDVYQASTFAGNPVVMAAGKAALENLKLRKDDYPQLSDKVQVLLEAIKRNASARKIGVAVSSYGSMFSIKFDDKKNFQGFYKVMLDGGVFLAPSEYESNFVSFAHTREDIERTIKVIDELG